MSSARIAPARACAYTVIRRVFEDGAYADRALHGEAVGLDARDRALATQLAYGTVQRRATLDHVAGCLLSRPLSRLEPPVLAALRLGLFQLLFLQGIADHAAVNDAVELAKRHSRGGAGLVNAVLRRGAREGRAVLDALHDRDPAGAAVFHSVPEWLARLWFRELGPSEARALLRRVNEPAEAVVRANALVAPDPASVLAALPVPGRLATGLPEGIVLEAPFDAHGSPLFAAGAIMPQSRGSMAVGHALAPRPGERILDLCAAPGGKATHVAALIGDRGQVVAVERNPRRARSLEQTCRRMQARCVRVEVGDASVPRADGPYDRVLVDPPCSGLGTLQSRPDLRWRASEESMAELAALQRRILDAAAAVLALGGTIVYSVCTISRLEGADVVEAFLADHEDFVGEPVPVALDGVSPEEAQVQLLPHRHGTDGFFIARLRRL